MNTLRMTCLLTLVCSTPLYAEGLLTYKPPQTGAPTMRIGGGTRGTSSAPVQLQVLAPLQTAFTAQPQPVLYWYQSQTQATSVEIAITQEGVDTPLLDKILPPIEKTGLQRFALRDAGIALQAGQEYRWSIAIVNDSEQRSGDIVASATIRYQPPNTPLQSVEQLAESGYWYDALQQLIDNHSPMANDLLKQIDLDIPAL